MYCAIFHLTFMENPKSLGLRNISFDSTGNSKQLEIPKKGTQLLFFIYFKDFIETNKKFYRSRLRFFNVKCIYKEAVLLFN